MIRWLKKIVAGRELVELERWRVESSYARRWLGEFPDVIAALDYLSAAASFGYGNISRVRDEMRARRGGNLHRGYQPASTGKPMPPPPGPVTDWDVAERDAEDAFRHHANGRVDYRFLGVTGEES